MRSVKCEARKETIAQFALVTNRMSSVCCTNMLVTSELFHDLHGLQLRVQTHSSHRLCTVLAGSAPRSKGNVPVHQAMHACEINTACQPHSLRRQTWSGAPSKTESYAAAASCAASSAL